MRTIKTFLRKTDKVSSRMMAGCSDTYCQVSTQHPLNGRVVCVLYASCMRPQDESLPMGQTRCRRLVACNSHTSRLQPEDDVDETWSVLNSLPPLYKGIAVCFKVNFLPDHWSQQ